MPLVRISVASGVGTLTLNRPERLNAFDGAMARELANAARQVVNDPRVRAIVVTGEGRGFCAGADVGFLEACVRERRYDDAIALLDSASEAVQLLGETPKPVLASVNGPAAGGGASLALACDLRIASDGASMGFVFHRLGLHPDMGATYTLPRLVGPARGLELFWPGEMLPAEECHRLGLVNRMVPDVELERATAAWAAQLAALPVTAAMLTKAALAADHAPGLRATLALERANQLTCFRSAEAAEGLAAYVAKRAPHFAGQ
jgi:2-(1,2-epoxy-1,2-dihydrophenyl)acetyl-CoA isomerase